MSAWTVAVAALALASPALAAGTQEPSGRGRARPADEMPHIAYLTSVDGELPADSTGRRAFVAGLREAFDADHYLTERPHGGPLRVSMPLSSRFRLVRGDAFGDEWQVSVTIMSWLHGDADGSSVPPPARGGDAAPDRLGAQGLADSLRGLRVNVAVLAPEAAAMGARPLPVREDLVLSVPRESRSAWFAHAGRMVGLLAVEELHHQSGDLAADTRVRLDRTVRTPVVVRHPSAPRR